MKCLDGITDSIDKSLSSFQRLVMDRNSKSQTRLSNGTELTDICIKKYPNTEATLGQCGVEALSTLEVAGCMLGDKVHGSLARAGKVRGQTPKVSESIGGGVWILFFLAQLSQNPGLLPCSVSLLLAMSQREGLEEATQV